MKHVIGRHWLAVVFLVLAYLGVGAAPYSDAQQARVARDILVDVDGGGFLGIEMEDVTADNMASYKLATERGVIVRSVVKGSPAEAAGIQEKDVVLEYAGMPVFSATQIRRLVRETPVGRKVDVAVSRDGKKVPLSVRIAKREGPESISVLRSDGGPGTFLYRGPEGRSFGFRVPGGRGAQVLPGLEWLEEGVPASKPRLGVTLQPLTDQMADFLGVPGRKGVLVTSTVEGSPAAGKLKAGDVIVQADNRAVEDPETLTKIVRGKDAGGKLELKIIRDRKEAIVTVDLPGVESKSTAKGYRL